MKMNVQPVPTLNERINEVRSLTAQIVNKEILPNESILWAWRTDGRFQDSDVQQARHLREEIKGKVKQAGIWAPHLPVEYGGAGLLRSAASVAAVLRADEVPSPERSDRAQVKDPGGDRHQAKSRDRQRYSPIE